jgi:hypothetical protein
VDQAGFPHDYRRRPSYRYVRIDSVRAAREAEAKSGVEALGSSGFVGFNFSGLRR